MPARRLAERRLARTIQLLIVIYPAEPHSFNPPLLAAVPMGVDCRRASQAVQAVANLQTDDPPGCPDGNRPEYWIAG